MNNLEFIGEYGTERNCLLGALISSGCWLGLRCEFVYLRRFMVVVMQILCGEFFLKMMKCVQVTHDCAPLVKFVCQCPNIGNKQNFLATRFKMFAEQGKDQYHRHIQIKLSDFHPLIASQVRQSRPDFDLHRLGSHEI